MVHLWPVHGVAFGFRESIAGRCGRFISWGRGRLITSTLCEIDNGHDSSTIVHARRG